MAINEGKLKMFTVNLIMRSAHRTKTYETATDVYTKEGLLCIRHYDADGFDMIHKYPLENMFRLEQEY